MKTIKIIDCVIYTVAIVLALVVLFRVPVENRKIQCSVRVGDPYEVVTYQPKNIFGMDAGEEYSVYEPKDKDYLMR